MDWIQGRVATVAWAAVVSVMALGVNQSWADVLYVSNAGNATIAKITATGSGSTFATTAVVGPEGLAV